ncbi:MAG: DUF2147 domain-containing protein [Desulfuromonadaceae bacterium]|nr:DUF2147 domain-containing protein [Desulfuromonadaceae bacterium]
MRILASFAIILLTAAIAFGAQPGEILGIWKTEMDESKVEVFRCGEKICGKIIWLKNPKYLDSNDGEIGTPIIDRKNPDPAVRSRPLIGLQILDGFTTEGGNIWGNGTCYDPKSGNTYRGKIHLAAPDRLELRGYIGIPLFGRTSVWRR